MWCRVAERMSGHRTAGRTHLLTEDVLRFETVLALDEFGVSADRLRVEVLDPALAGGKLDLVVDPPRGTVIEFKFPRDSSTGFSPDTMTMGELLRDFFRVAAVPAEDRWVVQLLNTRLVRYLEAAHSRYGLGWVDAPGQVLELAPRTVSSLPSTARRAMGDMSFGGGVSATCTVAQQVASQLILLAYRVDALRSVSDALEPRAPEAPAVRGIAGPPRVDRGTRDGARREILDAARAVMTRTGRSSFTMPEVIAEMRRRGTGYAEATIRTMISSHLCANANGDGVAGYTDLTRVGRGRYRLHS